MSEDGTDRILTNYNQFLVSINTNIDKDSKKRQDVILKLEEM